MENQRYSRLKGLSIILQKYEYEQLLKRFSLGTYSIYDSSPEGDNIIVSPAGLDPDLFEIGSYAPEALYYETQVGCPLCQKYTPKYPACQGCTFSKFDPTNGYELGWRVGCTNVVSILLTEAGFPEEQLNHLRFGKSYINFKYINKEVCFSQLKVIHNWLNTAFGG